MQIVVLVGQELNFIGYNIYKCVEWCPPDFPLLTKSTNECVKVCDSTKYLSSEENICYDKCLDSQYYFYNLGYIKKCSYKCNEITNYKFFYTIVDYNNKYTCLTQCLNSDYAYEITNICIKGNNCGTGYYRYINDTSTYQKNFCVTKCPSDKPFLHQNGTDCVVKCSGTYKYYIREFIHGETDTQRKCLNDCPLQYRYYEEKGDVIECFSTCDKGYYIDSAPKTGRRCLPTCPYPYNPYKSYNYTLIDGNDGIDKQCVINCPSSKKYHLPEPGSECLAECPDYAKFHKNDNVYCYNEKGLKANTDCTSIVYSSKECYTNNACGTKNTSLHAESQLTICLDKCIPEYGEYLTPYKTCVKDCKGPELQGQLFINDIQNKKCICENFYIFNTSNKMQCLRKFLYF